MTKPAAGEPADASLLNQSWQERHLRALAGDTCDHAGYLGNCPVCLDRYLALRRIYRGAPADAPPTLAEVDEARDHLGIWMRVNGDGHWDRLRVAMQGVLDAHTAAEQRVVALQLEIQNMKNEQNKATRMDTMGTPTDNLTVPANEVKSTS